MTLEENEDIELILNRLSQAIWHIINVLNTTYNSGYKTSISLKDHYDLISIHITDVNELTR